MYVVMGLLVRRSPSAVSFVMRCLPAVHFRVDGKASWRMTPDDQLVERSGAIKPYTGEQAGRHLQMSCNAKPHFHFAHFQKPKGLVVLIRNWPAVPFSISS